MTTTYCPYCDAMMPTPHDCGRELERESPQSSCFLSPDATATVKICLQRHLLTLALGLGRAEERGDALLIRNYSRTIERTQAALDEIDAKPF